MESIFLSKANQCGAKMKIKIIYTNGKEKLGTDYFDIADPSWQDEMQKRGMGLGAKFAHTGNGKQVWGIKYDDKHSDKLTESNED